MVKANDFPSGQGIDVHSGRIARGNRADPCGRFNLTDYFGCTGRSTPSSSFEFSKIVSDRHSERQQPFQCLGRGRERDGDFARRDGDSRGEIGELLADNGERRFDQDFRLGQSRAAQVIHGLRQFLPAAALVMRFFAGGQALQMSDQVLTGGYAA